MARINEKTVSVNGLTVHYYEVGEKHNEHILMLHGGFGSAWEQWREVLPLLAENHHVIAPDLPAYGQSDALSGMTLQRLVDWALGLMDALGIQQAALVGNSFGGLIARILAAQQPERAEALVLVNGGVIPSVPFLAKTIASIPVLGNLVYKQVTRSTSSRTQLELAIKTQSVFTPEFLANVQANQKALAGLMRCLSITPVPPERVPKCPTLLLWGEEDAVTPRVVAEHIQRAIPDAKLSLITEIGHMPQLEAPEIFAGQIQNFLRSAFRPKFPGGGRKTLGDN
ncbi:MAG: alpha/beta hydrolase [Halioglobus sp.]|nr:alpha/beta hydrolase [Halioglobus sp.]